MQQKWLYSLNDLRIQKKMSGPDLDNERKGRRIDKGYSCPFTQWLRLQVPTNAYTKKPCGDYFLRKVECL